MAMNPMQSQLRSVFALHANSAALQGRTIAWTYAELDRLSAELAQALVDRGAAPGQVVPLLMGRSPLLVLAQIALLRIGSAYSPIDLASPPARRQAMLDAIGSALLITDTERHVREDGDARVFDVSAWLDGRTATDVAHAADVWMAPPEGAPAYVMFTSGSTGEPKGVMVPHAGVARLVAHGSVLRFDARQRWAFMSSPGFDASTLEVWGPLLNGACCVVQEEALPALDMLGEFIAGQRITDAWLTSALFNAMVEDQLPALGRLRQLAIGGESVSATHARRALLAQPTLRLVNGYGPTENTTFTLCHPISLDDTALAGGVPIGTPLPGTQVRIEPTRPDAPDEGELWAAGDGVAIGYLGDAALTARKFVTLDGRRWYRTGDLVRRRADGVFLFVGRADRQVKLRGQRIELDEVEAVLGAAPGVGDAAVLLVGDAAQERRLVGVYTAQEGTDPADDALAAHMRQTLPDAAVPSQFVRVPHLPINLNGKLDRQALEARFATAELMDAPPTGLLMADRMDRVFATRGAHIALEADQQAVSYDELDRRSQALAARLLDLGVRADDEVALLLPRSVFLVVAILAVTRIGAIYVPIDLGSPPDRVASILKVLQPRFAVTDGRPDTPGLEGCACIAQPAFESTPHPHRAVPWVRRSADAALYIMFTSGSTGLPKGVLVPSRGLLALLVDTDWAEFPPDARWLQITSPAFDISSLEIWGALLHGATCVIQEGELPSLDELARVLTEERVSHVQLSASLFNAMVDTQLDALAGVRQLITGGERASPPHMRKLLLAHPQVRLINAYGPTETTVWSLSRAVSLPDTHLPAGIPIGRAIRGTRLRIESAPGVEAGLTDTGELLIAGAGVALGYVRDAQQTALKFVERDGHWWYRTGDLVKAGDDGTLEFHGRADRQVKIQGHRVEIDEVELAIAAYPGVGEVAVLLGGEDAGSRHLVAFYSGLAGTPPDPDRVAAYLATRLQSAAVPKSLHALDSLPQNQNGKVDRKALEQRLGQPQPRPAARDTDEASAPRGEFETGLIAIWREVMPHANITRQSHFLRVGGTSVLALHLAARVHAVMGRKLAPVDVLRHPVLHDQAALIAELAPLRRIAPPAAARGGEHIPMTHLQQNMLAGSATDVTGFSYLVHVGLQLPPRASLPAWREAFEQLALRHPSLRICAAHDGTAARGSLSPALPDGWWQAHPQLEAAPLDLDWSPALLSVINRPLDTQTQGSMRVDCWPLRDGGALLAWTLNHHIIDEASIDRALVELDALVSGRTLAPVYGSPFAFPAIESAWVDRPAAMGQWAAHIAETLDDCVHPLERPPALGRELKFELPRALQEQLRARGRALGVTPFPLLLVAYGQALQDVFGPRFRFVTTHFSRRSEPELIEPIGFLLDMRIIEAGALPDEARAATFARVDAALQRAQEPSFQWPDAFMKAVADISPSAAECLTQFGFTWRIDPSRDVTIGGQTVRVLRVPQTSARFAINLHVAQLGDEVGFSVEAVESAFASGQVAAVARAFERHLAAWCAAELRPSGMPQPLRGPPTPAQAAPGPHDGALVAAWSKWLRVPEASVSAASHFVRSGGSSLTAMRMAAELRRDHGIRLDLGAFLADATFAHLSMLSIERPIERPDGYVLVGPPDFERVLVLVPGSGGHAAAMFALADELRKGMPAGSAVAIVDLDAALHSAPQDDAMWFVSRRIVQVVRDLGQARTVGIVGYSMGGAIALRVAEELAPEPAIPIWLLDTFAPRTTQLGFWRKVERRLAWMLFGGRPNAEAPSPSSSSFVLGPQALPLSATPAQWEALTAQLTAGSFAAPRAKVRLIQARASVKHGGLLWQRRNNGFVPNQYASWSVHEIDGAHLDLPRHLAATTARIIVENDQFGAASSR